MGTSFPALAEYDYVIVGGGSAGCVLANRLSANPENLVLLVEAGGVDRSPLFRVPFGFLPLLRRAKFGWGLATVPEPHLDNRRLALPRGKVLGGTSSINGLIYIRGSAADYDHWNSDGVVGWSWREVLPYFIRAETNSSRRGPLHGTSGPLSVQDPRYESPISSAFIEAACRAGFERVADFNEGVAEGVNYYQLTIDKRLRSSSARAYLNSVCRRRSNLFVLTGTNVDRIHFLKRRATALTFRHEGRSTTVAARREILISAGAFASPQLLMLSGVGPADHLRDHSVPLVHDLPGVGSNLHDHLQARVIFRLRQPVSLNDQLGGIFARLRRFLEWSLRGTGPLAIAAGHVGLFARTLPGLPSPDVQFHVLPLSTATQPYRLDTFSGFTCSVCQLRPSSRGVLRLASGDPTRPPSIQMNYLSDPSDRDTIINAVKLARRIAAFPPLSELIAEELAPGQKVTTDDDLLAFVRNTGTSVHHACGTCKMGTDPLSVVDSRLRVRGLRNLRVVDTSIMPSITSGNTNAPAIMIAEKAADMILEEAASSL